MDLQYRHRRDALAEKLGAGTAIFRSAPMATMHSDVEYNFRQDSDFFYLTGFDEANAVAVLCPHHQEHHYVLFVQPKNPLLETWTGTRLGVDAAMETLGADAVYSIDDIDEHLPQYVSGADRIYYHLGGDRDFNERIIRLWQKLLAGYQRSGQAPLALEDPGPLLHPQRLVKSADELELVRTAVQIATEAHCTAMEMAKPGRYEYEIQAEVEHIFRKYGALGPAFPTIVASGSNACILHYTHNEHVIEAGNLLLVDAGCSYRYYNSDITRTFPVGQPMSYHQQALYELVLAAQKAAIAAVQPDAPCNAPHDCAVKTITQGLLDLGLLRGELEALIEAEAYKPFFMHRTSHWLGLDVHDVGSYKHDPDHWRSLQSGQILTIEPGIYIGPQIELAEEQEPVPEAWRGIGIRIEDDVLVRTAGHEVLTAGVPKEVLDIQS